MKTILTPVFAALLIAAASNRVLADKKHVFMIVTSGDAQTQLMSMVLTMQSVQKGARANILLCGPAGDLALKEAPASATTAQQPKGLSPQGLMQKIMDAGAQVEVCAIYLPNKGVEQSALLAGIGSAKPPVVAETLLAPNTRVLTF